MMNGIYVNDVPLNPSTRNKGMVLIMAMISLVVFSSLAVAMANLSDANLQVAVNLAEGKRASACAESGLETMRYWMDKVSFSGTVDNDERMSYVSTCLNEALEDGAVGNISSHYLAAYNCIIIPYVAKNSNEGEFFYGLMPQPCTDTLRLYVIGYHDSVSRVLQVDYTFGQRANMVFDYGVATKGPLSLQGNVLVTGLNLAIESNAYIESLNNILALQIKGNSQIGGNVTIANPLGTVDLQGGQAGIGGDTGQDAIDNHVTTGVPLTEWPESDPNYYEPYAINVMDVNIDTTSDVVLENIRIPVGLNPHFSGNATINGVVFIEQPNVVTFTGNVDITGIIVANGDWSDDSGTNQINITGNVSSDSVSDLPEDSQFDGIREDVGVFMMAPGFSVSFGGSFSTLSGAIAANGVTFYGNAGGNIQGSVINYSDVLMDLSGNTDLYFNRSGLTDVPAGFVPQLVMQYNSSSYSEVLSSDIVIYSVD